MPHVTEIWPTFKRFGWSAEWKRLLVDQAANKPGIAATLAWLCLRGDWGEVATGEALWRNLGPIFKQLIGVETADFLGVLSLAGSTGMDLSRVGDFLGLRRQESRDMAVGLASGDILTELPDRRLAAEPADLLAAEPADLRSALVKQVFFAGATSLGYHDLLDQVPNRSNAIFELLRAVHLGATLPAAEIRQLALTSQDVDVWRAIVALPEHTSWALQNLPIDPFRVSKEALEHEPLELNGF